MRSPFLKRVVDVIGGITVLGLTVPLMAAVAVAVYVSMGRPVLFRQVRAGWKGKPFTLLKFRTMRQAYGSNGRPLPDALRLTPVGRLLRRTSLDELPQILNVLQGDMSLFGPRPLLMRYLDRYTPQQARRHEVRPGLTGWAQVNGRNALAWEEKFELDVWYVDHWSLWLDARILLRTIRQLVCRKGINHPDEATMPEFMGPGAHDTASSPTASASFGRKPRRANRPTGADSPQEMQAPKDADTTDMATARPIAERTTWTTA